MPQAESAEVRQIFAAYGLQGQSLEAAVSAVTSNPKTWVGFMMREELGLERRDPRQALRSAVTIGLSYVAGGLVPPLPSREQSAASAAESAAAAAFFANVSFTSN